MKKTIIVSVIALSMFTVKPIQAQGTIYLSNLGQTSTGSFAVGSDSWAAVDFITGGNAGGYMLNSIQLQMIESLGNPNGFTVMLYGKANNPNTIVPGSSLGTLTGSLDPAMVGIYNYQSVSSLLLQPNTDYFIVLTSGTAVTTGAYEWSLTGSYSYNSIDGWGVGSNAGQIAFFLSSHDGSVWTSNQGNLQFSIDATAIPEPSPSWLLFLGGRVLICLLRRDQPTKS